MLCVGPSEGTPEKYKDYRNRTMDKYKNKVTDILIAIRSNSLKEEDKVKLKDELIKMIQVSK